MDFNSHARVGRDSTDVGGDEAKKHFNSHARVGRDIGRVRLTTTGRLNFNSHARVGRDAFIYSLNFFLQEFQLTRPCRA